MNQAAVILIIDDEEIIRNILSELIRTLGYQPLQAANKREALDLIACNPPDLVLLDIVIPGCDSLELLMQIKQNPALSNTSIIMISSADNLGTMAEFIKAGADDFLFKPFNLTLLKTRIAHVLEHIQHQQEMRTLFSNMAACQLKLQQVESSQEEFCKSLSHDINNALTGILMTAELMLMRTDAEPQRKNIADIIDSAEQIPALIQQRFKSVEEDNPKSRH